MRAGKGLFAGRAEGLALARDPSVGLNNCAWP